MENSDLGELTSAKAKKFELHNATLFNASVQKELEPLEQQYKSLSQQTSSLKEELKLVTLMNDAKEDAQKHVDPVVTMISGTVTNIEHRLNELELSKLKSIENIKKNASDKISLFPVDRYDEREQKLLFSIIEKLTNIYKKDEESCIQLKAEIENLKKENNNIMEARANLGDKTVALKKEISILKSDIGKSKANDAKVQNSILKYGKELKEINTHASALSSSTPSAEVLAKTKEELDETTLKLSDAKGQFVDLTNEINTYTTAIERLEKDYQHDLKELDQSAKKNESTFKAQKVDLEDGIRESKMRLKIVTQRRDKLLQKLKGYPKKSLVELERERKEHLDVQTKKSDKMQAQLVDLMRTREEVEKKSEIEIKKLIRYVESEKSILESTEKDLQQQDEQLLKNIEQTNLEKIQKQCELVKLEQEIKALESRRLEQLERILRGTTSPVKTQCFTKTNPLVKVPFVRIASSGDIFSNIPAIQGIEPFSPASIREREQRKIMNNRAVEFSLDYSDIPCAPHGRVTNKNEIAVCDGSRTNVKDNICEVEQVCTVQPPENFMDDSWFQNCDKDTSVESLSFHDSGPRVPKNIIESPTAARNISSPTVSTVHDLNRHNLDDSIDEIKGSSDESEWEI